MKAFWLVAMLLALLVTAWLVGQGFTTKVSDGGAPAALKTMERAGQAVKKVDAANQAQERRLDGAARE